MDPGQSRWADTWQRTVDGIAELPAVLKTLAGMVSSHAATQQLLLDNNLIPMLLELDTITSSHSIGQLAASVIGCASSGESICADVILEHRERRATLEQERAARARAAVISDVPLPAEINEMMEAIGDEEGWTCCICKEGYGSSPQALGFYVLAEGISSGFVTLSCHFVPIHFACHDAARHNAPRHRNEWDDAGVRNCERPCNAIFPIPGESLLVEQYRKAVFAFYERLHRNQPPALLVIHDIGHQLLRMADGKATANRVGLFPFLIVAGHTVLNSQPTGGTVTRTIMEEKMKLVLAGKAPASDGFALALLVLTLEEWNAVKTALLRLMITGLLKDTPEDQFFVRLKPIVFAWYVVGRMQKRLGKETGTEAVIGDAGLEIPSHMGAEWVMSFIHEVTCDGIALWERWKRFGEKLEGRADRIQDIQSLVTSCTHAAVVAEGQSPEEWIRSCIA
jgi:E3 ubiquitin-protein ligase UBR4